MNAAALFLTGRINRQVVLMATAWLILYFLVFRTYQPVTSIAFIAGSFALSMLCRKSDRYSFRFGYAALGFIFLAALLPVKTLLFFSTGFAVFYLIESFGYRLPFTAVICLFLMAPVSEYAANVFSFPIRLKLSGVVGTMLSQFEQNSHAAGNVIVHNGKEFSVDPACMGLNMLITSLLTGVMFLGYYMKKYDKRLHSFYSILYLCSVVLLNIAGNIFRILLLVVFDIAPASSLHEITGIVCLLIYVLIPAALIARLFIKKYGRDNKVNPAQQNISIRWRNHIGFFVAVAAVSLYSFRADTYENFGTLSERKVPGYVSSVYAPGIIKLQDNVSLVYIKFIRGFYDADHNPTICWKGSGYEFTNIRKQSLKNYAVYTSTLKKGNDQLYTAWWYSNGLDHTIDPLSWRIKLLKGAPHYAVVNITAASEAELMEQISQVIFHKKLNVLFAPE